MRVLPKYITRQVLVTLSVTVGVFTFVLLLVGSLKRLSDLLVNRNVGLTTVAQFLLLAMPKVLMFSLPMAMLATALLVFGRMSADNEVTAMRASGISLGQVAAPVLFVASMISILCLYISTTLMPLCQFQLKTLLLRIGLERPMSLLQENAPITDFPGYIIYLAHKKGNIIEDVEIYELDDNHNTLSRFHAQYGVVTPKVAERKVALDLYDVRGDWRDREDPADVHKIRPGATATRYPVELDLGKALRSLAAGKTLGDLTFPELRDEIARLRAQRDRYPASALASALVKKANQLSPDEQKLKALLGALASARMEAHQRIAWAAACFTFTMIGIPLGLKTSRRETSVGIAVSLGLAMVFYFFIVLANALKNRPLIHPEAILWFPNIMFELLGLWMLWRVARK
jgi:lipopolysaccharide export system permease protein